jgi:hypothetical protein
MTLVFLALGVMAGALTTVAGQGGGLLLLLAVSAFVGPRDALAITAPALLFGNLHRAILLRKSIDRPLALRMMVGAIPGALLGGLAAGIIPSWGLRAALVVMTALAIAKALGWLHFQISRRAFIPAGLGIGLLTGTSGGAGILLAPLLLSTGLTGRVFVATTSTIAVSMHIGRVIGYASLGFFDAKLALTTGVVTAAIFVGNGLGSRLNTALSKIGGEGGGGRAQSFLEYGTLVVCVALSVAGFG